MMVGQRKQKKLPRIVRHFIRRSFNEGGSLDEGGCSMLYALCSLLIRPRMRRIEFIIWGMTLKLQNN